MVGRRIPETLLLDMNILMGPILGFRGNDNGQWKVCALTVVNSTAANLTLKWKVGSKSTPVQGTALKRSTSSFTASAGETTRCER